MKVKAPNRYCDGCVWARVEVRGKLVFCPFVQCKRQALAVEHKNVTKSTRA